MKRAFDLVISVWNNFLILYKFRLTGTDISWGQTKRTKRTFGFAGMLRKNYTFQGSQNGINIRLDPWNHNKTWKECSERNMQKFEDIFGVGVHAVNGKSVLTPLVCQMHNTTWMIKFNHMWNRTHKQGIRPQVGGIHPCRWPLRGNGGNFQMARGQWFRVSQRHSGRLCTANPHLWMWEKLIFNCVWFEMAALNDCWSGSGILFPAEEGTTEPQHNCSSNQSADHSWYVLWYFSR